MALEARTSGGGPGGTGIRGNYVLLLSTPMYRNHSIFKQERYYVHMITLYSIYKLFLLVRICITFSYRGCFTDFADRFGQMGIWQMIVPITRPNALFCAQFDERTCGFRSNVWGFGTWHLAFGIWHLALGT